MSLASRKRLTRLLYPNISTRITGPFLLAVAIVAGLGVFIVTRLVAGSLQERFSNQLLDSASAATSSIVDTEREQLATLRLMAFTEGMDGALATGDVARLEELIRPVATNAEVDEVIVFDRDGQGVLQLIRGPQLSLDYTTSSPPDITNWLSVQHVLAAGPDALGDKYIDIVAAGSDYMFYISAPVLDGEEQLVGGISVGMRLQRLVEIASSQALSSVALYHHDGTGLGSTFREVNISQLLPDRITFNGLISQTQSKSPIVQKDANGVSYQVLYVPFRLRSQLVGIMAVGLPTNFIVEKIGTSRNSFGVLFAALFLVVGAIGLLTSRSIVRPVDRLVDTTRAIRDGDLTRRVGLTTPDELGELAISFDHMTGQLLKRNEEIEALYHQQLRTTAQWEAVLANIGDAVIVQDPGGVVILRNQAAETLVTAIRHDAHDSQLYNSISQHPEMYEQPRSIQFSNHHYSVQAKSVHLPSGDLMGHVLAFRDITALVESERLKDNLILQMSHELRTPLTAARGYVDLVRTFEEHNLTDEGQRFIDNSLGSMTTLQRMIDQVIDVSSIITDRFTVAFYQVNIAELIVECAERWSHVAEARQLSLSVTLPTDEIWMHGDSRYLPQMLDYLVSNACNYTLPDGTVELWAVPKSDHVLIYVSDTGVGIAPDEIDRVFERMYRGRSAGAGETDTRGLGLGLYITKHIVEAHHGTIKLESKLDYGTVITVSLPVQQNEFIQTRGAT